MKLKIIPIVVTAALSAMVLFGGWLLYQHYGLKQPLDKMANAIPGVESAEVKVSTSTVKVKVQLSPDADLGEVYRIIERDGAEQIGNKAFQLEADSMESPVLEKAWSYALFDIAEAMENRKYTAVRESMDQLSERFPGLTVRTDMDNQNVYISMQDGQFAKFVILPRQPSMLGVWSNA